MKPFIIFLTLLMCSCTHSFEVMHEGKLVAYVTVKTSHIKALKEHCQYVETLEGVASLCDVVSNNWKCEQGYKVISSKDIKKPISTIIE